MSSGSNGIPATLRLPMIAFFGAIWLHGALADELVYQPVNPAFGGSPLNGDWLLRNAQAQDTFEDPNAKSADLARQSELDRFNDTLERIALSRIASAALDEFTFADGTTSFVETDNFIIEATTTVDGVTTVTTTDKSTGAVSTFVLGSTP